MNWPQLVFSAEFLFAFLVCFLLLDLLYTIAFCYQNRDRRNIQGSTNYPKFISAAHYWPAATVRISSPTCFVNNSRKPDIQQIHCCRKCGQKVSFNANTNMLSVFIPLLERVSNDKHAMNNASNLQINSHYLHDDDGNDGSNASSELRGTAKKNAEVKHNLGQLTRFTRSRKQYGKYLIIGEQ